MNEKSVEMAVSTYLRAYETRNGSLSMREALRRVRRSTPTNLSDAELKLTIALEAMKLGIDIDLGGGPAS